jgi:alpha-tubulin suppressor-like RCC1 family protein
VSQKNAYVPVVVDRTGVLAGKVLVRISMPSWAGGLGGPTCVVSNRGKGFCWGSVALPTSIDPSGVLDSMQLSRVALSYGLPDRHTCVVTVAGRAYCWGDNSHGALGDGTTLDRVSPTAVATDGVLTGKRFSLVATGAYHSCLLDTAGLAYCFGSGYSGALGDGTFNALSAAVPVNRSGALNGKVLTAITAGLANTCALDTAGAAYCWGNNFNGELGIGTTAPSNLPAKVGAPA